MEAKYNKRLVVGLAIRIYNGGIKLKGKYIVEIGGLFHYKIRKNHGSAAIMKCSNCSQITEWSLLESCKSLSWLYMPLLTYNNRYTLLCNTCRRNQIEISGNDVELARKKIKIIKMFHKKKITKEQCLKKLSGLEFENPDDIWECPECNTENRNTSFKCSNCGYKIV